MNDITGSSYGCIKKLNIRSGSNLSAWAWNDDPLDCFKGLQTPMALLPRQQSDPR